MPDLALSDLIARSRVESGLRNNQYYDDAKIVAALNSGGSELYDLFTAANQHYVLSEFDFTLPGAFVDPTLATVVLPDDFQQGHSLDIFPGTGQVRTVRYLSNWLDRNNVCGGGLYLTGGRDPVYSFVGGKLRFFPPQSVPAAPYKLYYTPQWTTLALPATVSWAIDAAANAQNNGGFVRYAFGSSPGAHPSFVDAMLGGTVTVTYGSPNTAFNCTAAAITGPSPLSSGHVIQTAIPWPGGSFVNPASGTASVTYQPANTRATLMSVMVPWSEYLVVYAAIAINIDRQRSTSELERKLDRLKARVSSVLAARQEEPQQPPLSRGGSGWGGGWSWS